MNKYDVKIHIAQTETGEYVSSRDIANEVDIDEALKILKEFYKKDKEMDRWTVIDYSDEICEFAYKMLTEYPNSGVVMKQLSKSYNIIFNKNFELSLRIDRLHI